MEALGSAFPDPATAPRALPRSFSDRPWPPNSAGEGPQGPQVAGGWGPGAGECQVRVSLGCVPCAPVGIQPFPRSGEGVVVYAQPPSLPVIRGGPGPGPEAGAEAVPPRVCPPHPGRPQGRGGIGLAGQRGRPGEPRPSASGGLRRPRGRAGKHRASALLPIFPVSVLYCFLLLKLTCLIGNWCRIVSRGLLWNISTAVSFN